MSPENPDLTIAFLPHFTSSHIFPMVDLARKFAERGGGVNVIIVTTVGNAALFQASIDHDATTSGHRISTRTLRFPCAEVGLPDGIENLGNATSPEMSAKVEKGIQLLRDPMSELIREIRPDCIVSDMYLPWTADLADELRIPRILFYTSCMFYHCVFHQLKSHKPHEKVGGDSEKFMIPGLPDEITMSRSQLPDHFKTNSASDFELVNSIKSSEQRSYGLIHDTFYEIESKYIDFTRKQIGKRAWHTGPISLSFNKHKKTAFQGHTGVQIWLDSQPPNSVLYICFGSRVVFPDEQLVEIAAAIESSGHPFVWVVRKSLPESIESRIDAAGKGKIITGWAPQVALLNHPATGGYMTDCGWITVMEGVAAGVPLITWPLFAEHFFNEVLITQVLKIGVRVGAEVWNSGTDIKSPVLGKDQIREAVCYLMGSSEEMVAMRRRVKELGESASKAVEEGGSSYNDLTALIVALRNLSVNNK